MPAYNEEGNIRDVVEEWHAVVDLIGSESELVIWNDGSTDNTQDILEELLNEYPRLNVKSKQNSGHGATLVKAYSYAVLSNNFYVFQTDSDGQTSASDFWKFWEKREDYDFIIGIRKNRNDGVFRKIVAKCLKFLLFIIFGVNVADANTPFRLIKRDLLKYLLEKVPDDFFLSNALIATLAVKEKCTLKWIDIGFKPRENGKNSINLRQICKIGFSSVGEMMGVKKDL